jgi:diadenylate cyclase
VRTAINDAALAATTLAARRTGALIVFERREGLRTYVENGIVLDAAASFDLLLNVFTPDTPLHDGAVIVQGDRIAAAACFLPLTSNPELSKEVGSRHRAALGISEETDAVAVVVSEETGGISIAVGGRLESKVDPKNLRNRLYQLLVVEAEKGAAPGEDG